MGRIEFSPMTESVDTAQTPDQMFIQAANEMFGAGAAHLNTQQLAQIAQRLKMQVPQSLASRRIDKDHFDLSSGEPAQVMPAPAPNPMLAKAQLATKMAGQGKLVLFGRHP